MLNDSMNENGRLPSSFGMTYRKTLITFPLRKLILEWTPGDPATLTKTLYAGEKLEEKSTFLLPPDAEKAVGAFLKEKGFLKPEREERVRGYAGASFFTEIRTGGALYTVTTSDPPTAGIRAFPELEELLLSFASDENALGERCGENQRKEPLRVDPTGKKGNVPLTNAGDVTMKETEALLEQTFGGCEPGAAVLIARGDRILFDRGWGKADLVTEAEADGDTFFNIASCSKQFTAVGILQLAAAGKLSLTDPVSRYFPSFRAGFWRDITVGHLLSHSSGIPDKRGYLTRKQLIECDDTLAVEYMETLDELDFLPGTAYEYENPTFVLCGKLIEMISGLPFAEYMRKNVFDPAGMEETLYFDPARQDLIPRMAHGYVRSEVGEGWEECDYGEETCFATRPDGGLYTSTHEFFAWEKALREGRVLPPEYVRLAQSGVIPVTGSPYCEYQSRPNTWYGYGWFIEPRIDGISERVVYHTGDNGGFKILAARYPESDTLLLIFSSHPEYERYGLKNKIEAQLGIRK